MNVRAIFADRKSVFVGTFGLLSYWAIVCALMQEDTAQRFAIIIAGLAFYYGLIMAHMWSLPEGNLDGGAK